ncbi:TIGR03943 family protein [cf. Phormidesmis sp. LEGE 11477]|uniref:TIGR03943 family putative permease subunit n=1 Tax=cf. Phormidesmis sp. LEGE 11477 TaxID=1828680 RepID=UPI00187F2BB9|nr:TIGR03943 family protein [cf. Phormidesmis sp. LEGE 11477]MBE9062725.1 TIGR03943 family protein [cf. Phormidesmis sp. LEGE 11477]
MRSRSSNSSSPPQPPRQSRRGSGLFWREMLDVLALGVWSAMLFRYWFGGKLLLLLHPNYAWLSNSAAIILALLALYRAWQIFRATSASRSASASADSAHVTLLPGNLSSAILLTVAIFGLIYTPRAFASQTAVQRGISETLSLTRARPQRFERAATPEERSIIDWIRLVNVYPEPDAYEGESVDVKGFVIHPDNWPDNYLMVSRFVLTCCAADAYPVGLPVKLTDAAARADYAVDSWLSVTGQMQTETLDGRRQIAIAPTAIRAVEEPRNPYEY